jgi:hydroxymethylbilane synthase
MRDVLLFKKSALGSPALKILSSSPRRQYNLSNCLQDLLPNSPRTLEFEPVRGNVQTRVRKLMDGEQHGLVVAKAALDRMLSAERGEFQESRNFLKSSLEKLNWMVLPLTLNPAAAAQGALAVETKQGRGDIKKLFTGIHDPAVFECVQEERRLLKSWGGGCHQKIGVAIFDRSYGRVTLARGVRDSGEMIDIADLKTARPWKSGSASVERAEWFERQSLPFADASRFDAHWVSKAEALPDSVQIGSDHLVWASGVQTWKALAKRGIWVNGSSESFGEQEEMRVDHLAGRRQWVKWTHSLGAPFPHGETVRTYKLVPKTPAPSLDESHTHFFWSSGSAFLQALKVAPWLLKKEHWSGPGHTHETIERTVGESAAHIAFSREQWQKIMKQGLKP